MSTTDCIALCALLLSLINTIVQIWGKYSKKKKEEKRSLSIDFGRDPNYIFEVVATPPEIWKIIISIVNNSPNTIILKKIEAIFSNESGVEITRYSLSKAMLQRNGIAGSRLEPEYWFKTEVSLEITPEVPLRKQVLFIDVTDTNGRRYTSKKKWLENL